MISPFPTLLNSASLINKGFCISSAFYDYSASIFTGKNKKYNRIRIKVHTFLYAKFRAPMSPALTSSGNKFVLRILMYFYSSGVQVPPKKPSHLLVVRLTTSGIPHNKNDFWSNGPKVISINNITYVSTKQKSHIFIQNFP